MNEQTTKAYKELREELQKALNDSSTPEINALMPEYGEGLEEDYFNEDTGRQEIYKFNRTEEEAIKEAQQELLYGLGQPRFKELFYDGSLAIKAEEFLLALAREIVEC